MTLFWEDRRALAHAERARREQERRAATPERPVHWPWLHGPRPPLRPDLSYVDDSRERESRSA